MVLPLTAARLNHLARELDVSEAARAQQTLDKNLRHKNEKDASGILPESVYVVVNRQYDWLCVWLLCRLYCSNAIASPNCSTAVVPKYWRRNAEVQMPSMGFVTDLALAEKPTFPNVNR